jgi:hypothetical protein
MPHRHAVLDAIPLADQPRAGDRAVVQPSPPHLDPAAVELFAERLQAGDRLRLQAAVGQLLDASPRPEVRSIIARDLQVARANELRIEGDERRYPAGLKADLHRI